MAEQALALKFGQRGELRLDRALARAVDPADPQIDDIERIERKVAQIVVNGACEIGWRERRDPGGVGAAYRPDLGHDDEIVRVGMQSASRISWLVTWGP